VLHSSSVSGVAGIPHKQLVLSSGCWQSAGHMLDSVLSHVLSSLAVGKTLPNKNSYENHSWKPVMSSLVCWKSCFTLHTGLDKRLFAVDLAHGKSAFQHTLESKALGVLSNPADFNLFMAQTGCISTLFCKLLFWFLNSSNLVGVHMSYCFGAPLNILMGFRIS
jgi:hypothetical protein